MIGWGGDMRHERADFRPERVDFSGEGAWRGQTDEEMDGQLMDKVL